MSSRSADNASSISSRDGPVSGTAFPLIKVRDPFIAPLSDLLASILIPLPMSREGGRKIDVVLRQRISQCPWKALIQLIADEESVLSSYTTKAQSADVIASKSVHADGTTRREL